MQKIIRTATCRLGSYYSGLVRVIGLEPIWDHSRGILNPLRLPISPYSHIYVSFICLPELPIALCSPFILGASGHFIDGTKMFVCGFIPPKGNSYAQSLWITSAKMYFSKGKRGKKLKNSVRAASLLRVRSFSDHWRRHPDLNRGIKVLQTFALPLGYSAVYIFPRQFRKTAQIFFD